MVDKLRIDVFRADNNWTFLHIHSFLSFCCLSLYKYIFFLILFLHPTTSCKIETLMSFYVFRTQVFCVTMLCTTTITTTKLNFFFFVLHPTANATTSCKIETPSYLYLFRAQVFCVTVLCTYKENNAQKDIGAINCSK